MTWSSKSSVRDDSISNPEFYSRMFPKRIFHKIFKRKYFDVVLKGNDEADLQKLKTAELKIKELISNPDTTAGVHFRFNSQTKYWSFIYALNILLKNDVRTHLNLDDYIWVFTFVHKKIKGPQAIDYGPVDSDDYKAMRMREHAKKEDKERQQNIIKYLNEYSFQYSVILLIYSVLIVFSLRKLWVRSRSTKD